jgi:hypothetical protein
MHSVVWQIVPESGENLEEFIIDQFFNIVISDFPMAIALTIVFAVRLLRHFSLCSDFLVDTSFFDVTFTEQ